MNIFTDIISEFVDQNRAFTAFEVFLKAKDNGIIDGRYFDHKTDIVPEILGCDAMEFGDYTKTLVELMPNVKAYVYHHKDYDANDYIPLQSATSPSIATITPKVSDTKSKFSQLDKYNRLMIPTRFMREAGISPHSTVQIIAAQKAIRICKEAADGDYASQRSVERNGDLRLGYGILAQSGLGGKNFEIINEDFRNQPSVLIYCVDDQGNRIN